MNIDFNQILLQHRTTPNIDFFTSSETTIHAPTSFEVLAK